MDHVSRLDRRDDTEQQGHLLLKCEARGELRVHAQDIRCMSLGAKSGYNIKLEPVSDRK